MMRHLKDTAPIECNDQGGLLSKRLRDFFDLKTGRKYNMFL